MASPHLYVKSSAADDTNNGTTWALCKKTLPGVAAIDSTTDNRIWLSQAHAETLNAALNISLAGTAASPTWIVCVDDSAEPPTTLANTATVTTTGAYNISLNGFCYVRGVGFNVGTGAVNASFAFDSLSASVYQVMEDCSINIVATGSSALILMSAAANVNPSYIDWFDVDLSFGGASQGIRPTSTIFNWNGGSITASPDLTVGLIQPQSAGEYSRVVISGVDLSEVGVTGFIVGKFSGSPLDVIVRDCKVPAWTSGGLRTGTLQPGDRIQMFNCDSTDTNYRLWIEDYLGTIKSETGIYNDAGVDDGSAQGFSWIMVSNSNAEFPRQALISTEIVAWNETVTGTITATVEIVHNSQGGGTDGVLLDSEIWLEVMYLGTSGVPKGSWITDQCANLNLNSNAAAQATSSAAWTGDSTGWDTQKLSVSFDPKEKGYIVARVCLAKASATVYVDPLITIS